MIIHLPSSPFAPTEDSAMQTAAANSAFDAASLSASFVSPPRAPSSPQTRLTARRPSLRRAALLREARDDDSDDRPWSEAQIATAVYLAARGGTARAIAAATGKDIMRVRRQLDWLGVPLLMKNGAHQKVTPVKLRKSLFARLEKEAAKRGARPDDLASQVLALVLNDNLIDAVLSEDEANGRHADASLSVEAKAARRRARSDAALAKPYRPKVMRPNAS